MNLRLPRVAATAGRPLTGRGVLFMLLGFFGAVILVNLVMVRAAISTFGGLDTPSSYQAGLAFKAEEAAAVAQESRGWQVTAAIAPAGSGQAIIVDVADEAGNPVGGASVSLRLAHPVDERRDIVVAVAETTPGRYAGVALPEPGRWNLDIDIARGGERLFRSVNRVTIP